MLISDGKFRMYKYIIIIFLASTYNPLFSQTTIEGMFLEYGYNHLQHSFSVGAKTKGRDANRIAAFAGIEQFSKEKSYLNVEYDLGPVNICFESCKFKFDYSLDITLMGLDFIPHDKYNKNKPYGAMLLPLLSTSWLYLYQLQNDNILSIIKDEELAFKIFIIPSLLVNSKHYVSLASSKNMEKYKDLSVFARSKLDFYLENHKYSFWRYQPELGFQYLSIKKNKDASGWSASLSVKYIIDFIHGDFKKTSLQPAFSIGYFFGEMQN